MNQEQIRQVTARDDKWVPAKERVKISTTNVRLETIVPQKEETFQVIIDFWYTIKKVLGTNSYEFLLANKKCLVDAEVFQKILDICPRVQGVDFVEVLDDETTLTFFINLGYKVPLHKYPSMQNVEYPELIWEDFAFQIDYRQLKKDRHTYEADVDVSEESDSEPARKRTRSRRVIKKKVTITADDNIILEPDVALELGKYISLTEAAKEEATRQVHATHARIVTVLEPARRRPSEQLAADIMKALKESKKASRGQLGTRGSSEGNGVTPGVLDESTIVPATSSEVTGTKPGVLDQEKVTFEDNVILDWGSKQESEYSDEDDDDDNVDDDDDNDDDDDKSIDPEKTNDEETDDECVHSQENVQDDDEETDIELVHVVAQVNDGEDEDMTNAKDADTGNGNEDTIDAEISSLLDVQIQQEIPHIESPSVLTVPVSMISEPSVLTPIGETSSVAPAITLLLPPCNNSSPPPNVSSISHVLPQTTTPIPTPPITTEAPQVTMIPDPLPTIIQRVSILEKYVQELKEADNNTFIC
ncbi:hypothetical protein Tco_1020188 [Tanacetum coccineum]|uniref:Uncharacterized protein n=1 Tax=Tanacetum coccineum TaxID=301880 RepID=A0ABQ5G0S3_9ASTR